MFAFVQDRALQEQNNQLSKKVITISPNKIHLLVTNTYVNIKTGEGEGERGGTAKSVGSAEP